MAASTPVLDPDAILLHIGPHKTGTTAIQSLLNQLRPALGEHGVLYPGTEPNHHQEARVVTGRAAGWEGDTERLASEERWTALLAEVHGYGGRSVISSEFFGLCEDSQRERVVRDVGADRLHVLVAARNPGAIALSTWQQVLRDGKARPLETWLRQQFARPEPQPATSGFWGWADAATQVDGWRRHLPLERIHVVAIDESDRSLLPATFEQLLGLPAGLLTRAKPEHDNRGLTAVEADLLERTMTRARQKIADEGTTLSWKYFSFFFRFGYALNLIHSRTPPADEPRSVLPGWAAEQAVAEAGVQIERLRASGVAVIGDLETLRRPPRTGEPPQIETVPIELAAEAMAGIVRDANRRLLFLESEIERLRKRRRPAARQEAQLPTRDLATLLGSRLKAAAVRRVRATGGRRSGG